MTKFAIVSLTSSLLLTFGMDVFAAPKKAAKGAANAPAVLWQEPADIASRDMIYGPGGQEHQPKAPFKFVKEDMNGTSPKFVVTDADGTKWKVKLGLEAHPETAANRLVYAAGYYADEDYFLPDLKVDDMPTTLNRGDQFVEPNGITHNARLKRYLKGEEKSGNWQWKNNPFSGTREFNGLRVMMALINNWDLKDVNNTVYEYDGKRIYMVTDLGASFGTTGLRMSRAASKGNLDSYRDSKFITSATPMVVSFAGPSRPALGNMVAPADYRNRIKMEWIGKDIPTADARWIGSILAKLSAQQIQDVFGGAGYSPQEVVGFAQIVQQRIADLNKL